MDRSTTPDIFTSGNIPFESRTELVDGATFSAARLGTSIMSMTCAGTYPIVNSANETIATVSYESIGRYQGAMAGTCTSTADGKVLFTFELNKKYDKKYRTDGAIEFPILDGNDKVIMVCGGGQGDYSIFTKPDGSIIEAKRLVGCGSPQGKNLILTLVCCCCACYWIWKSLHLPEVTNVESGGIEWSSLETLNIKDQVGRTKLTFEGAQTDDEKLQFLIISTIVNIERLTHTPGTHH
mmetsp:Transcript_22937/g.26403  ORF Transcript_22937/g.26403 Transcript_22937/m.26403 type:complete len:238 (-) Transcript_22937:79-792(-)